MNKQFREMSRKSSKATKESQKQRVGRESKMMRARDDVGPQHRHRNEERGKASRGLRFERATAFLPVGGGKMDNV